MKRPAVEHVQALKQEFNAFLKDANTQTRFNLLMMIERYYNEAEKRNRPAPSPIVISDDAWREAGYPED